MSKNIEIYNKDITNSVKKSIEKISKDDNIVKNYANNLLKFTKAIMPVYTSTLKKSGRIRKSGKNSYDVIFDATRGEQLKKDPDKKFKRFSPTEKEENESYAKFVKLNGENFLTYSYDEYTKGKGSKIKLKLWEGEEVEIKVQGNLDLRRNYGFLTKIKREGGLKKYIQKAYSINKKIANAKDDLNYLSDILDDFSNSLKESTLKNISTINRLKKNYNEEETASRINVSEFYNYVKEYEKKLKKLESYKLNSANEKYVNKKEFKDYKKYENYYSNFKKTVLKYKNSIKNVDNEKQIAYIKQQRNKYQNEISTRESKLKTKEYEINELQKLFGGIKSYNDLPEDMKDFYIETTYEINKRTYKYPQINPKYIKRNVEISGENRDIKLISDYNLKKYNSKLMVSSIYYQNATKYLDENTKMIFLRQGYNYFDFKQNKKISVESFSNSLSYERRENLNNIYNSKEKYKNDLELIKEAFKRNKITNEKDDNYGKYKYLNETYTYEQLKDLKKIVENRINTLNHNYISKAREIFNSDEFKDYINKFKRRRKRYYENVKNYPFKDINKALENKEKSFVSKNIKEIEKIKSSIEYYKRLDRSLKERKMKINRSR